MAYEATPWDQYTTAGVKGAQGLMDSTSAAPYPSYVSSATNAPVSTNYYNYTANAPIAQAKVVDYQGLMGQDYDKLQSALTTPGANAATTAYNQGYNRLTNNMGGNGLYGSSIMQNQAINSLDSVYQQALADNAAKAVASRYMMQQADLSDLNKFNAQNYATDVNQNANLYQANAADASNRNSYNAGKLNWDNTNATNLNTWKNAQDYEKYTYQLAQNAYNNQANEAKINQYLALAGQGAPLSAAAMQYSMAQQQNAAAQQAAQQAASAQNTASWLGAAGSLAGGLLATNNSGSNTLMNAISAIKDW
jgi:hypothetical protein